MSDVISTLMVLLRIPYFLPTLLTVDWLDDERSLVGSKGAPEVR
jgi:hypothetical protein